MDKVGNDGVITIEESKTAETHLTTVDGMEYNRGYASPFMVTDSTKMVSELEKPLILLVDKKISSMMELRPIIEQIAVDGRKIQIIAEDFEGEGLAFLLVNKTQGRLDVCASLAPSFGQHKTDCLEDIAILTGGHVFKPDETGGVKLSEATIDMLGTAEKVITNTDKTIIVNGGGSEENVLKRVEEIKEKLEHVKTDYEKEQLQERIARLVSGVAIINVGAQTEVEMREKKDRVDDALHATKSAIAEGIVEGGGVALLRALDSLTNIPFENHDQEMGAKLIYDSIQEPIKQIAFNSGVNGEVVVSKIMESEKNIGYNAKTGTFEDMFKACVLDPTKVTKSALKNASSVASMILLSDCLIAEIPKESNDMQLPQMGIPGMM
jgi:chaperonin GroEL